MPYVQADIDALKAALVTGALIVRYADGRTLTYRSLDEIERILALATKEVALAAGTPVSQLVKVGHASGVR